MRAAQEAALDFVQSSFQRHLQRFIDFNIEAAAINAVVSGSFFSVFIIDT